MIYAAEARRHIAEFQDYYERLQRSEAAIALRTALRAAEHLIETRPEQGLAAPRPYPALARAGQAWVKSGRYWVAYNHTVPPVILAVFYYTADIPGRFWA